MKEIGCDVCRIEFVEKFGTPALTITLERAPDYATVISTDHAKKIIDTLFPNIDVDIYNTLHGLITIAFLSGWEHAMQEVYDEKV